MWWLALHEKLVAWYLEEGLMTHGIREGNGAFRSSEED